MMIKHILAPVDGSEHANKAVELAGDLAAKYGAALSLLHVLPRDTAERRLGQLRRYAASENMNVTEADLIRAAADELLEQAAERARKAGATEVNLLAEEGDPAVVIVEHAEIHKIDLIVMGRRGLGELEGLLLGSISHKVTQLASCACLTVK